MNIEAAFSSLPIAAEYGDGSQRFFLATGSPGELGLLKALGTAFGAREDATLVWVKAGTGLSLELLQSGQVDMVMVHAPTEVDKAIAAGWATGKQLIGSNEFYLVGPSHDPADIATSPNVVEAFRRIAASGAQFVSRGDNSGTHQKELQIWAQAGAQPKSNTYIATHEFMTASLKIANSNAAYFMSDSSTWIMERGVAPDLKLLFRGDRLLVNTYHAVLAAKGSTPGYDKAAEFIAFVASADGQKVIREYGMPEYSEALYNDADYARQYD